MMELNLNEHTTLPMVGFGTYLIPAEDARKAVYNAMIAGYRHIDTAEAYGNEKGVGLGIQDAAKELGLSRDDFAVTTKLWCGGFGQASKNYDTTIESLMTSLEKLQLDYVDLYLIHAPLAKDERLEQWRAMVELKKMGKAKAIGVSNYSEAHIEEMRAAGMPLPDANQIELHPWSQKPELVNYLNENGISIIAYSSLAPLSTWRTAAGHDSAKTDEMRAEGEQADAPFKQMAEKYGVTEAQVLLRWALQKGYAVLPKSTNVDRIRQNFDLLSFEIDDADMRAIEGMDRGEPLAWIVGDPTQFA